ncbi:MAG: hypothetical protein HDR32_06320 [Treponema sp.]|nr:hypothetical protein [Treponema sp.]MBD5447347.1 hypothetical protein [Treponema sp.]MDE6245948.1 hypothetical protein [Treponemataceae bacterium]
MALKDELPKIVKSALKNEDDATRLLVNKLIDLTRKNEGKANQDQIIKAAMFAEIEKCLNSGIIKEEG